MQPWGRLSESSRCTIGDLILPDGREPFAIPITVVSNSQYMGQFCFQLHSILLTETNFDSVRSCSSTIGEQLMGAFSLAASCHRNLGSIKFDKEITQGTLLGPCPLTQVTVEVFRTVNIRMHLRQF